MGVKAFLGMFDGTKNFAEDVDNYALGNLGDNVNLKTAVVPRSLQLAYSVMAGDEKDQHEVSAAMMAISYYQANGMGIYPTANTKNFNSSNKADKRTGIIREGETFTGYKFKTLDNGFVIWALQDTGTTTIKGYAYQGRGDNVEKL
jgi:hypothetical protein